MNTYTEGLNFHAELDIAFLGGESPDYGAVVYLEDNKVKVWFHIHDEGQHLNNLLMRPSPNHLHDAMIAMHRIMEVEEKQEHYSTDNGSAIYVPLKYVLLENHDIQFFGDGVVLQADLPDLANFVAQAIWAENHGEEEINGDVPTPMWDVFVDNGLFLKLLEMNSSGTVVV